MKTYAQISPCQTSSSGNVTVTWDGTACDYQRSYGARERWGPYHRQAVRFVGRTLERFGARLDSWSWGWR